MTIINFFIFIFRLCPPGNNNTNSPPLSTQSLTQHSTSSTSSSSSAIISSAHLNNHHHNQHLNSHHQNTTLSIGGLNLTASTIGSSSNTTAIGLNLSSLAPTSSDGINNLTNSNQGHLSGGNFSLSGVNSLNLVSSQSTSLVPELGMSHWINEGTVKSETRSPGLDGSGVVSNLSSSSVTAPHLDSNLFCTNPSLDAAQGSNSYDHKSDYYNYYNSMQQYTPSFYSSYGTQYTTRAPAKIPSPNTYLSTSYPTNNNSTQLYPTYGYNNFGQFTSSQQDYGNYYNDQYGYYNSSYSPYVSSPGSSGSQGFQIATGLSGRLSRAS